MGRYTEETLLKMRLAKLGKKLSEEHKRKLSLLRLGKPLSGKTKEKIRLSNIGKVVSMETREKQRKAKIGTRASEETLKKLSAAKTGHAVSEKTRRKISEAQAMEKSHNWNGGIYHRADGYTLIKTTGHPNAPKDGYKPEHRLVMEKLLGRFLLLNEVVHHINGIKNDNREENLMLFANDLEHRKYHKELRIKEMVAI